MFRGNLVNKIGATAIAAVTSTVSWPAGAADAAAAFDGPEPTVLLVLGIALAAVGIYRWRRSNRRN